MAKLKHHLIHSKRRGASNIYATTINTSNQKSADTLAQCLSHAGLPTQSLPDPLPAIWKKACFNVGLNALSAITGSSPGLIGQDPELAAITDTLVDEAILVASELGIPVDKTQVSAMLNHAFKHHLRHKPSMLQNIEAGLPTEIDSLNGFIVTKAAELGVPAPANATLTRLIKAKEAATQFWTKHPS